MKFDFTGDIDKLIPAWKILQQAKPVMDFVYLMKAKRVVEQDTGVTLTLEEFGDFLLDIEKKITSHKTHGA